jgi:hypothetical protein
MYPGGGRHPATSPSSRHASRNSDPLARTDKPPPTGTHDSHAQRPGVIRPKLRECVWPRMLARIGALSGCCAGQMLRRRVVNVYHVPSPLADIVSPRVRSGATELRPRRGRRGCPGCTRLAPEPASHPAATSPGPKVAGTCPRGRPTRCQGRAWVVARALLRERGVRLPLPEQRPRRWGR